MMQIVDSHCHLNMAEFNGELAHIIAQARANNVQYMQTICTKITDFPALLQITEQYDNIFCSVGVHPCEVEPQKIISCNELLILSKHDKVIGLGETGLDFYHDATQKSAQIESFVNHIIVARQSKLPVIIHTRSADSEMMRILRDEQQKDPFPALIHCFTSTYEMAKLAIDLGMYISISGIVTFKNAHELQSIVKKIPLSSMLIETDAPYLAPMPFRGKRCEPAFVKHTAEFIAILRDQTLSEVIEVTTNNFFKLFTKAKIDPSL